MWKTYNTVNSSMATTCMLVSMLAIPLPTEPVMLACRLCICDTLGGRSSSSSSSSGSNADSGVATDAGGEGCVCPALRAGVVGGRLTVVRAADSPEDMRWCWAAILRMKRALEASDWGPSTADPVH